MLESKYLSAAGMYIYVGIPEKVRSRYQYGKRRFKMTENCKGKTAKVAKTLH
jgi:hypothetical protein